MRRLALLVAWALCCAAFAMAAVGRAEDRRPGTDAFLRSRGGLWKKPRWPGYEEAHRLHLDARMRLLVTRWLDFPIDHPQRNLVLRQAVSALRTARELLPEDPEILHELASAEHSLAVHDRRLARTAIQHFEQLRATVPDWEPSDVAFALGSLHAQVLDFRRAAREYERCLEVALEPQLAAQGNLGEMRMLSGDLEGAITSYRQAIALAERFQATQSLALSYWGLAVAEDRIGDPTLALEDARRALSTAPMEILRSPGVFFEPEGELEYYEGLGFLAKAAGSELTPSERQAPLTQAKARFLRYLATAGRSSPYATAARAHLERIEARLSPPRSGKSRASKARSGKVQSSAVQSSAVQSSAVRSSAVRSRTARSHERRAGKRNAPAPKHAREGSTTDSASDRAQPRKQPTSKQR